MSRYRVGFVHPDDVAYIIDTHDSDEPIIGHAANADEADAWILDREAKESRPSYRLDCCGRNGEKYAKDVAVFYPALMSWEQAREAYDDAIRSEVGYEDDPLIYHVVLVTDGEARR